MNFYTLIHTVLDTASKHKLIEEVWYGDIYEFENQPSRKYNNFVLTITNTTEGEDITTYSFNAFVTDRLTDSKDNLIEVQSASKTILSQILKETFDQIGDITYTFWTEKFNDLCAGCYASFSVSVPNEFTCADENMFVQPKMIPYDIKPLAVVTTQKINTLKAIRELFRVDGVLVWSLQMAKEFVEQTEYTASEFAIKNGYDDEAHTTFSEDKYYVLMDTLKELGVDTFFETYWREEDTK